MNFEYLKTETYLDSIDIPNTGNCAVQVFNDDGEAWYLKVKTSLGWSAITHFGPVGAEDNSVEYKFNLTYFNIEFDAKKLYKIIRDFLNDSKKNITQACLIELEECDIIEKTIMNNWKTD